MKFKIRGAATSHTPPVLEEKELCKQAEAEALAAIDSRLHKSLPKLPPDVQLIIMRGIVAIAAPALVGRLFMDYTAEDWRTLKYAALARGYGIGGRDLYNALLAAITDRDQKKRLLQFDPDIKPKQNKNKTKFKIRGTSVPIATGKFKVRISDKGENPKTSLSSQKKSVRRKGA